MIAIAWVHVARGAFEIAVPELEKVASLTEDHRITGLALHNLGAIAAERGDWELARAQFMESVQRFQSAGYQRGVAFAHNNYGRAALDHGNFVLAVDLLQAAVSSAKKAADPDLLALATMNVAEALAGTGELAQAESMAKIALAHFAVSGNGWRRVECERLLGDLEKQSDREGAAREWWSSALETARSIGAQLEVVKLEQRLDRARHEDRRARFQRRLVRQRVSGEVTRLQREGLRVCVVHAGHLLELTIGVLVDVPAGGI